MDLLGSSPLSWLGPSAGAVVVVYLFLKYQATRDRSLANALDKLAKSSDKVAKATNKSAAATERGANEAAQRNGHLAELAIENQKTTMTAIKALKDTQPSKPPSEVTTTVSTVTK